MVDGSLACCIFSNKVFSFSVTSPPLFRLGNEPLLPTSLVLLLAAAAALTSATLFLRRDGDKLGVEDDEAEGNDEVPAASTPSPSPSPSSTLTKDTLPSDLGASAIGSLFWIGSCITSLS